MIFKIEGVALGSNPRFNGFSFISVSRKDGTFKIGDNFSFNSGKYFNVIGRQQECQFIVGDKATLTIGNNVGLSSSSLICYLEIEINDNVKIGGNTVIYDSDFHDIDYRNRIKIPEDRRNVRMAKVKICKNVFIGSHCTILKGVTIGENSVIGSGSVIAKDIPANEIWAGNPAKFIRKLN